MLRILTADDHAVVRAGVKQILSESNDMRGIAEAETGAEAVRQAALGHFDVILLDISLPDQSGLEVLKILRQQNPDQAVLMLSMHPEEQYAIRALKAGARGYLTKESASAELVSAVRKVSGISSDDDRRRRGLILRVMTGRELPRALCAAYPDALPRLEAFVADGLLAPTADGWRVTDLGRFFLRNVAMVFDAYLDTQAAYSRTV